LARLDEHPADIIGWEAMSDVQPGNPAVRPELRRHYQPGVVFHAPHCIDGGNAMSVPVGAAMEAHPNYQFDQCFVGLFSIVNDPVALAEIMPHVSIENITTKRHPYTPSDPRDTSRPQPADAIRPLCSVCRGTHEHEA
jgi:hypothetical protein